MEHARIPVDVRCAKTDAQSATSCGSNAGSRALAPPERATRQTEDKSLSNGHVRRLAEWGEGHTMDVERKTNGLCSQK